MTTTTRKRSAERQEFLESVITTAVEGGTGYWAAVSDYGYWHRTAESDATDAEYAVLHEMSQDPDNDEVLSGGNDWSGHYLAKELLLDVEAVARAVGTITRGEAIVGEFGSEHNRPLGDYAVKTIKEASRENDGGMIDADMADLIAQVALLGIVRYG